MNAKLINALVITFLFIVMGEARALMPELMRFTEEVIVGGWAIYGLTIMAVSYVLQKILETE